MNMDSDTGRASRTGRKRRLVLLSKAMVAVLLVAYLLWQADWTAVWQAMVDTGPLLLLAALVLMLLSVSISAWKWQMILRLHGAEIPFGFLHRVYFIAVFFNNFLPTSIGGDGYRIFATWDKAHSRSGAVIAVVTERLTGILALLAIGYVSAISVHSRSHDPISGLLVKAGTAGLVVSVPLVIIAWRLGWFQRLLSRRSLPGKLGMILAHLDDYRKHAGETLKILLVSFFFQIHNSLAIFLLLRAGMGVPVSLDELFVILTVMNLAAILPISINGIGVMEGSFIYVARFYDVPYDAALATLLMIRALLVIISLVGAWFYLRPGAARPMRSGAESTSES